MSSHRNHPWFFRRHEPVVTLLLAALPALHACDRSSSPAPPAASVAVPVAPASTPSAELGPRTASSLHAPPPDVGSWRRLVSSGRLLAQPDAPETCEPDELAHVLVVDGAQEAPLVAFASTAGCRVLESTNGPFPGRAACCHPASPPAPPVATGGGSSCARALFDDFARNEGNPNGSPPPLSTGGVAGILNHGTFLADCGVPPTTAVIICAASAAHRAQGVSVALLPTDAQLAHCVASRVRALPFTASATMDVTITRFAPDSP